MTSDTFDCAACQAKHIWRASLVKNELKCTKEGEDESTRPCSRSQRQRDKPCSGANICLHCDANAPMTALCDSCVGERVLLHNVDHAFVALLEDVPSRAELLATLRRTPSTWVDVFGAQNGALAVPPRCFVCDTLIRSSIYVPTDKPTLRSCRDCYVKALRLGKRCARDPLLLTLASSSSVCSSSQVHLVYASVVEICDFGGRSDELVDDRRDVTLPQALLDSSTKYSELGATSNNNNNNAVDSSSANDADDAVYADVVTHRYSVYEGDDERDSNVVVGDNVPRYRDARGYADASRW